MSEGVGYLPVRRPRRTAGFSLVDVMFALAVLAVGLLGVMSLLLALRARNESSSQARLATRACQEVMELALSQSYVRPLPQWAAFWNVQRFQPRKLLVLDKERLDPRNIAQDDLRTYVGGVSVRDVSEATHPGTLYEIAVWVDTTGLTPKPIQARLVTRRSSR